MDYLYLIRQSWYTLDIYLGALWKFNRNEKKLRLFALLFDNKHCLMRKIVYAFQIFC